MHARDPRRDSGIETLGDFRERDIAFADPISESGYLFSLNEFVEAGLVGSPEEADDFFWRSVLRRRPSASHAGNDSESC